MHIHGYQLFRKMYRLAMQNQIAISKSKNYRLIFIVRKLNLKLIKLK